MQQPFPPILLRISIPIQYRPERITSDRRELSDRASVPVACADTWLVLRPRLSSKRGSKSQPGCVPVPVRPRCRLSPSLASSAPVPPARCRYDEECVRPRDVVTVTTLVTQSQPPSTTPRRIHSFTSHPITTSRPQSTTSPPPPCCPVTRPLYTGSRKQQGRLGP